MDGVRQQLPAVAVAAAAAEAGEVQVGGLDAALVALLPSGLQSERHLRVEGGRQQVLQSSSSSSRSSGDLVELLAAVLEREPGVLGSLLQAQQQCRHDIEGVYRLYCCHLATAAAAEQQKQPDPGGSECRCSSACGGSECMGVAAEATVDGEHAAAVARLLALPREEAHAVLRSYAVAATAKDCAVMLTLQRCLPVAPSQQQQQQAAQQLQREAAQELQVGLVRVPGCGGSDGVAAAVGGDAGGAAWYRYRLCFVDLDRKPLAKIPAHHDLDRRILLAAAAAEGVEAVAVTE